MLQLIVWWVQIKIHLQKDIVPQKEKNPKKPLPGAKAYTKICLLM
jgi:hypothetical protein